MKSYLSSLLPRLKQFSQDLDKKEIFVDIPWVIVDEQENRQVYIFKRDGKLVMSLNGQVTEGKWEYLSSAKRLLIDRVLDKILLKQNFIDGTVMVLRKDGLDENLLLANENLLPDLDVARYLKNLFYEKNKVGIALLKTGETLEIYDYQGFILENKVTIEGEPVSDGLVESAKADVKFIIENSKIVRVLEKQSYDTDFGTIIIEQAKDSGPAKGDAVYLNENNYAPDGRYKIGFLRYITVKGGQIAK